MRTWLAVWSVSLDLGATEWAEASRNTDFYDVDMLDFPDFIFKYKWPIFK